jgi:hypothetical protein
MSDETLDLFAFAMNSFIATVEQAESVELANIICETVDVVGIIRSLDPEATEKDVAAYLLNRSFKPILSDQKFYWIFKEKTPAI